MHYWIEKLGLTKHPEGGYFREVYRSDEKLTQVSLPGRYGGDRSLATSIYFLLGGKEFSSFHRIQSDETWHFYRGSALELFVLDNHGEVTQYFLGQEIDSGEQLQVTILRNQWFGARVADKESFALLGCTVAPGFHFDDFELADRMKLTAEFPQHKAIINALTFGE